MSAVPPEYSVPLGSKDSAKEAWDALKAMRIGSGRTKKMKAQQLRREYDTLMFHDWEAVEDFPSGCSHLSVSWRQMTSSSTMRKQPPSICPHANQVHPDRTLHQHADRRVHPHD